MIRLFVARTSFAASPARLFGPVLLSLAVAGGQAVAGVSPGDAQAALEVHNRARVVVGVGPLTLSPELSASAQRWADRLASGGKMVHDRSASGREGENLAMSTGGLDARAASAMWLRERATWAGGCGETFVVARYAAPGNMRGVKPYPSARKAFGG